VRLPCVISETGKAFDLRLLTRDLHAGCVQVASHLSQSRQVHLDAPYPPQGQDKRGLNVGIKVYFTVLLYMVALLLGMSSGEGSGWGCKDHATVRGILL